jgi:hypothetical protein
MIIIKVKANQKNRFMLLKVRVDSSMPVDTFKIRRKKQGQA